MKKTLIALTLAAILVIALSVAVFAETDATAPQWFQDMITWKKAQIKQAVAAGRLTEEQAKPYYDRIDQMVKFHTENGFTNMMGTGAGSCHGGLNGGTRSGKINFGSGMMNRVY